MNAINSTPSVLVDTGIEVIDLHENAEFLSRRLHVRDSAAQLEGLQRLARAFVERPETVLQELVDSTVSLCGADSAGISVERPDKTENDYYHWVATAGGLCRILECDSASASECLRHLPGAGDTTTVSRIAGVLRSDGYPGVKRDRRYPAAVACGWGCGAQCG